MLSHAANANTNGPPTLVNTDQGTAMAFWTADSLAPAKPMPLPTVSSVPWSSEIESASLSPVSATGGLPTLRVAPSSALLFTPVPREGDSVAPEMFGSAGLRFTSSRLVTDAIASLHGETTYPYALTGQLFSRFLQARGSRLGAMFAQRPCSGLGSSPQPATV